MLSPLQLLKLPKPQDPVPNPGRTRAFVVVTGWDGNTTTKQVYILQLSQPYELKLAHTSTDDVNDILWLSDEEFIYTSQRGVFSVRAHDWSSPTHLFDFPSGVDPTNLKYNDGWIYFSGQVWTDGDFAKVEEHDRAYEKRNTSARVYEELPIRKWNQWLTPGKAWTVGKVSLGGVVHNLLDVGMTSSEPFGIDVHGDRVVANWDRRKGTVWRSDVLLIDGGGLKNLTPEEDHGGLSTPVFSRDGKRIAWVQPHGVNGESWKYEVTVYEVSTGVTTRWTKDHDCMVGGLFWSEDSQTMYITADHRGRTVLHWLISPDESPQINTDGLGSIRSVIPLGDHLVVTASSIATPVETYLLDPSRPAQPRKLTSWSKPLNVEVEEFWCKGAAHSDIMSWVVKPPSYTPTKSWPMVMFVHGGPYGSTADEWAVSWSLALYAEMGYVAVGLNYTGSTGFGIRFIKRLTEDDPVQPQRDIEATLEAVQQRYSVDPARTALAGASYGGYLVNWMQGHNPGFSAFITHDGIFDRSSHAFSTDFPGSTLSKVKNWQDSKVMEQGNPRARIAKWTTPHLIIQGGKDFRCPEVDGISPFSVLQLKGIPSRLVYFPDEGHGVSTERNIVFWYDEIFAWLERWIGGGPGKAFEQKRSRWSLW